MMKLILLCTLATNILVSAVTNDDNNPLAEKGNAAAVQDDDLEEKIAPNDEPIPGEGEDSESVADEAETGRTSICQGFLNWWGERNKNIFCFADLDESRRCEKLWKCLEPFYCEAPRTRLCCNRTVNGACLSLAAIVYFVMNNQIQDYIKEKEVFMDEHEAQISQIATLESEKDALEDRVQSRGDTIDTLEDTIIRLERDLNITKGNQIDWRGQTFNLKDQVIRPMCHALEHDYDGTLSEQLYNIGQEYLNIWTRECWAVTPAPTPHDIPNSQRAILPLNTAAQDAENELRRIADLTRARD